MAIWLLTSLFGKLDHFTLGRFCFTSLKIVSISQTCSFSQMCSSLLQRDQKDNVPVKSAQQHKMEIRGREDLDDGMIAR